MLISICIWYMVHSQLQLMCSAQLWLVHSQLQLMWLVWLMHGAVDCWCAQLWLMHGWLLMCDYLHLTHLLTHGRKHAEKFFGCRPPPLFTGLNTMFSQVRGVGGQFLHFRRIGFVLYLCHWQHTNQHQTSINPASTQHQTSINHLQTSILPTVTLQQSYTIPTANPFIISHAKSSQISCNLTNNHNHSITLF